MPAAGLPPIVLPSRLGGAARVRTPASQVQSGSALTKDAINRANTPLANYRQTRSAPDLMRYLAAGNALASTAGLNLVALADTGIQLKAYNSLSQEFSREGLLAAELIVSGINTSSDYSKGYSDKRSLPCLIESLLREVSLTGGCGVELVLDKYRIPDRLEMFPYDEITWISNGRGGKYPQQRPKTGQPADLNYPTVFISESFKSAAEKYATPFAASGAQSLFQLEMFLEDAWRVIRMAGEPRLTASLDYDLLVRSAPAEVQSDPVKLAAFLETARAQIETLLSGLNPQDALVVYNQVTVDKIEAGNEKKDFSELMNVYTGQAASALKSNASLLGLRTGGSQNVASVEALMSTKTARRLQLPVEEALSRALTLAVRLLGVDAYVEVAFKPIELRPETELEAHKAMQQARVLELLSLGRITDDEAQMMLGLGSTPDAAEDLSGSGFYKSKPADTLPASGTNAIGRNAGANPDPSAGGSDNSQRV
jgi:hypothetical protein